MGILFWRGRVSKAEFRREITTAARRRLPALKERHHGVTMRLLLAVLLGVTLPLAASAATPLRDGDLVFQTSRSGQSLAIQRATHSPWSHMGIVFLRNGTPMVFEASATVRYTPLATWAARGAGGAYSVRRLKDRPTAAQLAKLRVAARHFDGKPYDPFFEWSDERIYCSELVWKMYRDALGIDIGALQKLREFDLRDPAVEAKLRERYGSRIPLDEAVISPAAMYDSPLLETVERRRVDRTAP